MAGRAGAPGGRPRAVRVRPPGILGLGAFVLDHLEALEADFRRYYQLDLAAAIWGPAPISGRYLRALVQGIPLGDSALGRALDVSAAKGWGNTEELLAGAVELIHSTNRILISAFSKKGTQPPKPLKIPRPGDQKKERRPATIEELKGFFGGAVRHDNAR